MHLDSSDGDHDEIASPESNSYRGIELALKDRAVIGDDETVLQWTDNSIHNKLINRKGNLVMVQSDDGDKVSFVDHEITQEERESESNYEICGGISDNLLPTSGVVKTKKEEMVGDDDAYDKRNELLDDHSIVFSAIHE